MPTPILQYYWIVKLKNNNVFAQFNGITGEEYLWKDCPADFKEFCWYRIENPDIDNLIYKLKGSETIEPFRTTGFKVGASNSNVLSYNIRVLKNNKPVEIHTITPDSVVSMKTYEPV